MEKEFNPYVVLGVSRNAALKEIKEARNKAARSYHPDKGGSDELMKLINRAFTVLIDPLKREEFNEKNDVDENELADIVGHLFSGRRLSEEFEQLLKEWATEFEKNKRNGFDDNWETEFASIVKLVLAKAQKKSKQVRIDEKNTYQQRFQTNLIEDLSKIETFLIQHIPKDTWDWYLEPMKLIPILNFLNNDLWQYTLDTVETAQKIAELLTSKQEHISVDIEFLKNFGRRWREFKLQEKDSSCCLVEANVSQYKKLLEPKKTNSFFSNRLSTGKPIQSDPLYFTVQEPPQWIAENERNRCSLCSEEFWFLRRKNHCYSCGDIHCAKCADCLTLPLLGYTTEVTVCKKCIREYPYKLSQLWLSKACEYSGEKCILPLSVANSYKVLSSSQWISVGDTFANKNDILPAAWCYYYGNLELKEWTKILIRSIQEYNAFNTITIMESITKLHKPSSKFWIELADQISAMSSQSNNGYLLMFSCYHKAKISAQQLMEKLIICKEKDLMTFLVYYLTVEFELESLMPILTDLIINGYGKIVGLLCSTTSASYQDLLQLVCKFIDIKKFSVAAYLLNCIIEKFSLNWDIVLKEIRNKPYNGIIKCFELFTSRNINPITWLSIISENASNNNYVQAVALCLNLMRIALGNKSWENIIEICCEEKQFDFVPLLVRMIDNSNKVNWENFAEKFITIDDKLSISFYILNNRSWEEIGNNFFNYKFYITALQCYINGKLSNEQLLGKANKLVQFNQSDDALHYYVYLYKHSSFSKTILLMNIYHIISTKMTVKMREDFLKECLLALPNPLTDPNLAIFHYELSQIISEYDKELALQALELACSLDSSWSSELNRLQQEIALSKNLPFKDKLIKAIYAKSAKRVVVLTRKMNSIDCEVAQNYLLSQTNKIAIDQYPPDYGAVLFVLSACIAKSQQKYSVALNFLQKAIFTLPNDDIMDSIELIMEDGLINIKDMMINDLKNLEKSQEILLADLNVVNLDFVTKLRKIPSINTIRKFEQGISNHSHSDLESALLYLDLSMGVDNPSSVVECHLLSSIHFLRAMKTSRNNNDIYSYKQAIFELVTGATLIAHRTVALPMQFHVLRLSLSILLAAIKEFSTVKSIFQVSNSNSKSNVALHTSESRLLSMILQRMFHLAQVTPLCILPNSTCGDSIYMDVITRNFEENWLYNHRHKLGRSDQHYYLFEGVWKGWIDKIKFGEARYLAMNSLLDEKGWNMKQVQSLLDWSYLPRDAEGWLSQSISSLKIQGPKFYRVRGVEIDLKTGVIAPLLEPGTGNKALFGWNDVLTVLKLGIKGSFFTLDQPNYQMTAHPFQAMKYYPPSLDGTHYLATLLHTDYLLKMFSVGVEISALPPFAYKSASKGFLNRLPQPLQQILRPVQIGVAEESAHRFWIEAGELLYDTEFNDNKITFYFSDIPMVVKTHLLERNEHGELVDSEKHSDDTPESVFANNFTENYEAIGQYFPEFLRLKELLKLGGVITIIQNTYHSLLDQISSLHIDEEPIMEYLQEILNNVEYPRNTSYNIDMYMEKVMRDNGICESQLPYSQSSEIRGNIRSKLAQADSDTYSGVKTAIARSFEISESSVQPYIARFLNNSELQSLVNLLRETLYNKKRNELQSVCEKIEILGLKLNKESDSSVSLSNNNNVPCTWVPAVYCTAVGDYNRKTSVYGGINLGLQMRNFNKGSSGRNESSGGNSGRSSGGNSGGSSGRHDENKKAFFEMLKSDTKNYKYTNPLSANNANAYLELAREFGYKHNSTRSHLFEGHWAPNKKDSSIKPPHVHFESKHVAVEDPHCIIQSKK